MNLAWLAAVLRPRDLASYPTSLEQATRYSPAVLAAVVLGENWRIESVLGNGALDLAEAPDEAIAQVQRIFSRDTLKQGLEELSRGLLRDKPGDPARDCALTLLACCAAAELDDYDRCFALIDSQLRWTASAHTPSDRLAQAVLLQQKSLRFLDAGIPHEEASASSLRLLADFDVNACSPFEVSPGVSRSYKETLAQIVAASRAAAHSLLRGPELLTETSASSITSRQSLVADRDANELLQIDRQRAATYSDFLSQLFDQRFRSTTIWIIGGPRVADLFRSTLALELFGHRKVYEARRELAQLRFVQASMQEGYSLLDDTVRLLGDAVRLLRHAVASRELDLALRWLRAAGPLEGLSVDARQIIQMRRRQERLRGVELRVLQASADLLTQNEAGLALESVLNSLLAGGPPDLPGHSELNVIRQETAWTTAASLANTAGRVDDVARLLLDEMLRVESQDPLRDYAIARALENLEWDQVGAEQKQRFTNWLSYSSDTLPATTEVLSSRLGATTRAVDDQSLDVETIATHLNAVTRGFLLDEELVREAVSVIRESLSEIRRAAQAQGTAATRSYSLGGIPTADVAAGLILYGGAVDLWVDLADFLTDISVQRADRSPAFERLAREASEIPETARDRFMAAASTVLEAPEHILGSAIVPYPEALRFLGAFSLINENSVLGLTAQLAGTAGEKGRQEAARTVAALSRTTSSAWLLALAIQFSQDDNVEVRAHAGKSLAQLSRSRTPLANLSGSRLVALLRQDGLLVPVLVLRGLSGPADGLRGDVRHQVEQMREDHPSRAVRRQAAQFLGER